MHDSKVSGASDAKMRVGSAIDSLKRCLSEDHVSYQVVFAERIVVRSLGREETFELGIHSLVGALLLRPGSNARILFAGGGPEALATMLGPAATEYFGERCR